MANEMSGILFSRVETVTGGAYQVASRPEEHFLQEVVTPIYEVLLKVTEIYSLFFLLYIGDCVT